MHICYLLPPIERYSPISGGALATVTMQQARRLTARGHKVSVLAPDTRDEMYDVGHVTRLKKCGRDELNLVQRFLSTKIKRRVFDWAWLYYDYYLAAFRAALLAMRPTPDAVIIFNDLITPQYVRALLPDVKIITRLSNEVGVSARYIAKTIAAVDHFTPISTYIRDWTAQKYPIPLAQMTVIANGADLETFWPRDDFLQPVSPVRALFIGRINHDKGPDIAAEAVAKLRAEGLPITLSVAGSQWFYATGCEEKDPYLRQVKELLTAANAEYLGHVTRHKVPELVRAHDIVLVPSRWQEPMSQVIFEAMASGCAVIASNRGGLPEAGGEGAICVDPDDFSQVLDALRGLVVDSQLLRNYKLRAQKRASEMTWDKNTDALEALLLAPSKSTAR